MVALLVAMASLTYRYSRRSITKREKIKILAHEYEKALLDGDREYAQTVGRAYYSILRGGRMSKEDEKALAFELAVMFRSAS